MTPSANDPTSLAQAQRNVLDSIQAFCASRNTQMASEYISDAFANFLFSYSNQLVPWNAQPPAPPASYVVAYFDDPTKPGTQWAYASQSGPAVCSVPDFPRRSAPPSAGHVQVGVIQPGCFFDAARTQPFFSVGIDDRAANGYMTPPVISEDGVRGIFQKDMYPFGGWYILLQRI